MKILIPSLERHDAMQDVLSLTGRENVKVYVKTHEMDNYRKAIGDDLVFEVPEDVIGMGAIRKFLVDQHRNEDYFIIMDDDITGVYYRFSDPMDVIVEPSHFRQVLDNSAQVAEDLGTPIFTYDATLNPNMYSYLDPFHFSGNVPSIHGIIPSLLGNINYDPRLIVMNDYDIALQCKYHKRFLFIDKRYNLKYSDKWFNKGGSSTLRNAEVLQEMSRILKRKYGKIIKMVPGKIQCAVEFPF